jgi:ABC-type glutathione transport system ATPase component
MPDQAPLLPVREVSKSFGAVAAVQNVSLDLYGGEAHAPLGENGAGQSTIAMGRRPLGRFKTIDRTAMLREAGPPTELTATNIDKFDF